jgi:hypothetical protein
MRIILETLKPLDQLCQLLASRSLVSAFFVTNTYQQEEDPATVNIARLKLEAVNHEQIVRSSGTNRQGLGLMLEEKTMGCKTLEQKVQELEQNLLENVSEVKAFRKKLVTVVMIGRNPASLRTLTSALGA